MTIDVCDVLFALQDPNRLAVLRHLRDALAVSPAYRFPVSVKPNTLTYHLDVLESAGLVCGTRRVGRNGVLLKLNREHEFADLVDCVLGLL